jgi:hypothetical protein
MIAKNQNLPVQGPQNHLLGTVFIDRQQLQNQKNLECLGNKKMPRSRHFFNVFLHQNF